MTVTLMLLKMVEKHGSVFSDNLPQGLWVSRVIASKHNESRVYATLNGYRNDDFKPYAYLSEDYGTTWKEIKFKFT